MTMKTVTRNGTFHASDDEVDGYYTVIADVPAEPIIPRAFDLTGGYVSNGTWTPGGDTVSYSDSYAVSANEVYIISLCSTVGSRFRTMFSAEDIAATPTERVAGKTVNNVSNPQPYANVMQSRAKSGEHLTGTPPYGYKKDGSDPKKWIIDEEPAKVIREIFKLFLGGKNATQIAEMMAEKGYDAPGEYLAKQKQYFKGKSVTFDTPRALWHPGTVLNILDRQEYCGHTVSYRRKTISYKTHKTTLNDEADWIITKNTQAPIVDEDTWQAVHKMRESGRRRKEHVWDKGPLNGFLYCPDCGSKLYFSHPSRLKTSGTYLCGYYLHYKKCSTHYIRRDELEPVVLAQLRKDCAFAREHEDDFLKMVEKKTRQQGEDAFRQGEREYGEAKSRIEEIDQIINQLYEDKVSGGLSAERFSIMLTKYEEEQETLRGKCEKLQVQITAARTTSDNAKQFIRVVRKFTELQELTPEIVATLIERVEIGQAQVVEGVKKQEIKIIYNFIGDIRE